MMRFKTIFACAACTLAAAQFAAAQGDAAEGLLNQLVAPKPVAVVPAKPVVSAPIPAEKPVVAQTVKAPEVKVPEMKTPEVSVPVVAPMPAEKPISLVNTNKPMLSLAHPKKRGGGASFLNRTTASTNTPQRETVITSDKIDFDNREGVILFDENVFVDDPQFSMRSDRLLIFMEGTNDVSQVMSIGHVVFSNEMRSATCNKAIYTRKDGQIVMTGDVRLKTEGETAGEVQGEKVVIWLDDERVEVLLGAKITLPPGAFKKAAEQK